MYEKIREKVTGKLNYQALKNSLNKKNLLEVKKNSIISNSYVIGQTSWQEYGKYIFTLL